MRALFFLNSLHGGGTEKVCLNLAKGLFKLNIESDFVTVYNRKNDFDIPDYIHVFSIGLKEPILTRFNLIKCVPKVNKFISGKKYVLITAHLNPAQYLASMTSVGEMTFYVMHIPRILEDRNRGYYYKAKLRKLLNGKKVVTVSKGMKQELCSNYEIDEKNIITIYNPCDVERFRNTVKLESPNKRRYILFMGRLEEEKNPHMALNLYFKGEFYKNYDLIYLGKGSLESSLRKKIDELGMEDYIYIIGFQKEPEQWLLNASLLLSCSNVEGMPLNIVEALSCGIPVVATDCPYGPREIMIDELSEYLINPEQEFDKSISTMTDALREYPEITNKYFDRFDDALILQNYLKTWKECFSDSDSIG